MDCSLQGFKKVCTHLPPPLIINLDTRVRHFRFEIIIVMRALARVNAFKMPNIDQGSGHINHHVQQLCM